MFSFFFFKWLFSSANKPRTVQVAHEIWAVLSVFYFWINRLLLHRSNVRNTQLKLQLLDADSVVLVRSHQLWPHLAPLEGSQQPTARWLRRDTEAWPNVGVRHASYCNAAWRANAGSAWVTSANLWKPVGTAWQVVESVCGATGGKNWETWIQNQQRHKLMLQFCSQWLQLVHRTCTYFNTYTCHH